MTEKLSLSNQSIDYELYGTNRQEMEYESPSEISKESLEKIKAREKRGARILSIFNRDRLAA